MNKNAMKKSVLVLSAVIFLALVGIVVMNQAGKNANANSHLNLGNAQNIQTQTYRSAALKTEFQYAKEENGKTVLVREEGNTISIYYEGQNPSDGQSLEVWSKDKTKTLQAAIEAQFLTGFDPSKCFVDAAPKSLLSGIGKVINYPQNQSAGEPWWQAGANCPAGYTLTNSHAFFWAPTEDSQAFAYLNLEAPLAAAPQGAISWAETIRFSE